MQLQVGGGGGAKQPYLGAKELGVAVTTCYSETWSRSLSEYETFNKGLIILTKKWLTFFWWTGCSLFASKTVNKSFVYNAGSAINSAYCKSFITSPPGLFKMQFY